MEKIMLPNGGFPPITLCVKKELKDKNNKDTKKGFFYSTKTNNLNIRNILNKSKQIKKVIEMPREEEELEIVNSI